MKYLVAIAALAGAACRDNAASSESSSGSGSGSAKPVVAAAAAVDASAPFDCLPADDDLYLVAGDPLRACAADAERCVTLAVATGVVAPAKFVEQAPDPEIPHAVVEDHGGKWAACFDGVCKPLGKKARAAIVKLQEARTKKPAPGAPEPTATTDLAAVVIPAEFGVEVFNVKKDRPLLSRGEMGLEDATPVGTALVTHWLPPTTAVYTSAGKLVVELGPEGRTAMIDDKRWLLVSPFHELYVFDGPPKQTAHKLDLDPDHAAPTTVQVDLAVLADKSVAVLMASDAAASVSHVDPTRPALLKRWPVTVCGKR